MSEINAAIAKAAGKVHILGKSEKNNFDGYNFVSVDKFLEMVNPICAEHGLFPFIDETNYEFFTNAKGSAWIRVFYEITLHHSSGETLGPSRRAVAVPHNGAQAYGSAQSYALKQYFRSLFMIPTGDKDDADFNATDDTIKAPLTDAWEDGIMDSLPEDPSPETVAEAYAEQIGEEIAKYKDVKWLNNYLKKHNKHIGFIEQYAPELHAKLKTEVGLKREEITPKVAAE